MKGAAAIIGVVMMFAILTALFIAYGPSLNLFGGGEGTLHKTELQSDIYIMGHALDAANLYMDTSLNYAVYQACYDNLRRAGLSEITPETGESGFAYLPELTSDQFYQNLASVTETYLNRYSDESYAFLTEHRVSLPASKVTITPGQKESEFLATTVPASMMETYSRAESGESITLRASADISETYDMPCYPIYKKTAELNPSIQGDFQQSFSDTTDYLKDYAANAVTCSDIESCSQKLTEEFQTKLSSEARPFERGNYMITPEIVDASVVVSLMDSGEIKSYQLSATQKVTINETELYAKYYPVWNGTHISFENMELVYLTGMTGTQLIEDPA